MESLWGTGYGSWVLWLGAWHGFGFWDGEIVMIALYMSIYIYILIPSVLLSELGARKRYIKVAIGRDVLVLILVWR